MYIYITFTITITIKFDVKRCMYVQRYLVICVAPILARNNNRPKVTKPGPAVASRRARVK